MKKPKTYLDTSVISFYFADDSPEKREITRKFFDQELQSGKYEVYISNLNIEELSNTTDLNLRKKFIEFVHDLSAERLPVTDEVEQIVEIFIQEEIIPAKYRDDAIHLALALYNSMDYIVSWNFKHIVKPKTKKAVRSFAIKEGYKDIEIITPQEVTENEE